MPSQDTTNKRIRRVDITTGVTTTLAGGATFWEQVASEAIIRFSFSPYDVAIDPSGAFALVVTTIIYRVDVTTGAITMLAGGTTGFSDGDGTSARFQYPRGVAIDPSGAFALVAVRAWPCAATPFTPPTQRALQQPASHTSQARTASL